jgi:hypothetical protein
MEKSDQLWRREILTEQTIRLLQLLHPTTEDAPRSAGDYRSRCNRECHKWLFFLHRRLLILTSLASTKGSPPPLALAQVHRR